MSEYGREFEADFLEYGLDYGWTPRLIRRGASHGPFGWETDTEPRGHSAYEVEYRGGRTREARPRGAGFGQPGGRYGWRHSGYGHSADSAGYPGEYGRERAFGRYGGGRAGNLGYGPEFGYERELGRLPREPRQHQRKGRWETDYGDPFHDRERGTPIRMIRGEWSRYDEDYTRRRGTYERERRPPPWRRRS